MAAHVSNLTYCSLRRRTAGLDVRRREILLTLQATLSHRRRDCKVSAGRFGATTAYAKIVDERIGELRETHVLGFQRFGVFVARRFKPAVRTCEATAYRLEQLSHAAMHLLDLLQTRIQVEVEFQNVIHIQAMAERTAAQVRIQRAVEGFSIIAISYYLLSLAKVGFEALDHAGYHVSPYAMLLSIPIAVCAVGLAFFRVKKALGTVH